MCIRDRREYERLLDFAAEIGLEQGFYQEGDTAKESFIPPFDCRGVLPERNREKGVDADTGSRKTEQNVRRPIR